ncbi:MAG: hypothetical protein ACLU9S_10905 [Oscillospiraceae bacterium]
MLGGCGVLLGNFERPPSPHKTPEEFCGALSWPRIQPQSPSVDSVEINETIDASPETICGLMPAMDRLGRKRGCRLYLPMS